MFDRFVELGEFITAFILKALLVLLPALAAIGFAAVLCNSMVYW